MTSKEALNKLKHHIDGTELKGSEILKCLITITNDLQLLESLKMLIIVEENKRTTLGNGRYHIRIRNDILYDDRFAKGLKERLENE